MKTDKAIHVYFVDINSLVDVVDFNLQLNEKLIKALNADSVYRIEIIAAKPNIPILRAVAAFLFNYTGKAVHTIEGDVITAKDLQAVVKMFPDFLGGRWNWMYIGDNGKLSKDFGIKKGGDLGTTDE